MDRYYTQDPQRAHPGHTRQKGIPHCVKVQSFSVDDKFPGLGGVEAEVVFSRPLLNSDAREPMLPDPTSKYVSSAYFIIEFSSWVGWRSEAATTYEGGPLYYAGRYQSNLRDHVNDLGGMATMIEVFGHPVIDVIW